MKKNIKVLVVDDEENIINFLKMGLEAEGFEVYTAQDGREAIQLAREIAPEIIILDVMLPKVDGYEACEEIKKCIDTSIIMLTAREDVDDRIKGLDVGADDYMIKPFSYRELVARIKARIRSKQVVTKEQQENELSNNLGKFQVNDKAHEIRYKGKVIELSLTEYKLLSYLLDHKGIVLSKAQILDAVWGYDFNGDDNVVEVYIRYLRNKLGDKAHKVIYTVRGVGYKVNVDGE